MRVLNLGCGVQSSTLYLMACAGKLDIDCAIFADTQAEPDDVYAYLRYLRRQSGPPIHIGTAGNLEQDLLKACGREMPHRVSNPPFFVKLFAPYPTTFIRYVTVSWDDDKHAQQSELFARPTLYAAPLANEQGMLFRQCTRDYKIRVIERVIRTLAGNTRKLADNAITQLYGISMDEMERMTESKHRWAQHGYPLIERRMTREDCQTWLADNGHPLAPKSACYFCPYRSDAGWKHMQQTQPKTYARAVKFDRLMRSRGSLPNVRGNVYVHRSCQPLVAVNFDDASVDMFSDECAGVCGV